jgi:tRNA (guanine37-N1)-methyltransferase
MTNQKPFTITVITLFPEMFPGPLALSIPGRGLKNHYWALKTIQMRDFGVGKHRQVDDTPYGGGVGMVIRPDVVDDAIMCALSFYECHPPIIYLSPKGVPLVQERLHDWLPSKCDGMIFLCGRYEGIDQRVIDCWRKYPNWHEVSVGDYVLSGGDLAAMVIIDAVVRLIPGVLVKQDATTIETFGQNLLEFPHYTKPRVWKSVEVPNILCCGDHGKIDTWRHEQSLLETQSNRPDLWLKYKKKEKT